MKDAVDAAIAPKHATFNFRFQSGRQAQLLIDSRASSEDLLELVATLSGPGGVRAKLAEWNQPVPGLVVARGLPS